jgi:hypothetical protein
VGRRPGFAGTRDRTCGPGFSFSAQLPRTIPMGKPQPQPKTPRRRLFFRCTRSRADDPQLAALARIAARLERNPHQLPIETWAELLLLLNHAEYYEPPAAEGPTTHLPGSDGKLAVMMGRIARGLSPFHPSDGMRAWREFIAEELDGRDGWGLAIETCGGRLRGVRAVKLQGRREPEPPCDEA